MPWVIERDGTWHSESGWRTTTDEARRFQRIEEAHRVKDQLLATTLAGLPGELHIKELPT